MKEIIRRTVAAASFLGTEDKRIIGVNVDEICLHRLLTPDVEYISDWSDLQEYTGTDSADENARVDAILAFELKYGTEEAKCFLDTASAVCRKLILSIRKEEGAGTSSLWEIKKYLRNKGFGVTGELLDLPEEILIECFEKISPDLLRKNIDCTGCGACANVCIKNAIAMEYDETGFLKPAVDRLKCIDCGMCVKSCSALADEFSREEEMKAYAAWADDDIRLQSSSGGVFSVIAEDFIDKGGYVFGAAFDGHFDCIHKSINQKEDLAQLRHSKYMQSNTLFTFREVKKLLAKKVPVVYVGTHCQIAGLKSYLKEWGASEHLLTVGLLCFGVPSGIVFKKYLEETYGIDNVANVEFRNKEKLGWSPFGYRIELKNGRVVYPEWEKDAYQQVFHKQMFRNDACEHCRYIEMPMEADMTIGDFWGVGIHDASWNDGKGTSLILANTEKGKAYVNEISHKFQKIENVPTSWMMNKGNAIGKIPRPRHENYLYFRQLLKTHTVKTAFDKAFHNYHQIGLVVMRNSNLGNALTNYALYRYLSDLGYSVLLIGEPYSEYKNLFVSQPIPRWDISLCLQDEYEMQSHNKTCEMFIVGSDQLWRGLMVQHLNFHSLLNWATSDKYKISYATSFGIDELDGSNLLKEKMRYFLGRFQKISVREISGADLMRREFGLEAEVVADPVFLCDKKYYEKLADIGKLSFSERSYVGAYLLDPDKDKSSALKLLASKYSAGNAFAITEQGMVLKDIYGGVINIVEDYSVEEWLALVRGCEYFITDSFHGMCLALIFNKPFIVMYKKNSWRGYTRIYNLLSMLQLESRLVESLDGIDAVIGSAVIYESVNTKLAEMITKSKRWLSDAIKGKDNYSQKWNTYDILNESLKRMSMEIKALDGKIHCLQESFAEERKLYYVEINNLYEELGKPLTTAFFGAGNCFERNVDLISRVVRMQIVCDNKSTLWGKSVSGFRCIAPEALKEYENIEIVITIDDPDIVKEVHMQLCGMGISRIYHINEWMNLHGIRGHERIGVNG